MIPTFATESGTQLPHCNRFLAAYTHRPYVESDIHAIASIPYGTKKFCQCLESFVSFFRPSESVAASCDQLLIPYCLVQTPPGLDVAHFPPLRFVSSIGAADQMLQGISFIHMISHFAFYPAPGSQPGTEIPLPG